MPVSAFVQSQMMTEAQHRLAAGDAQTAVGIYSKLLKLKPSDPQLLYFLGTSHRAAGNFGEARRHLEKAVKSRPNDVGFIHDLALVAKRQGRFEEAHRLLDRALKINPHDPIVIGSKSECYFLQGEFDAARDLLLPVIESENVDISVALAFAQLSPRIGERERAAQVLERLVLQQPLSSVARISAQFRLGELYDALGQYDRAFEHYRAANAGKRMHFDPEAYSKLVDQMLQLWTPEAFKKLPRASGSTARAVFIVGMPRSGTTLIEQILASNPAVFGGGELDDIGRMIHALQHDLGGTMSLLTDLPSLTPTVVSRLSRDYLAALQRINHPAQRVTDKMPLNAMHLGFISLILPQAKIIHCVRDPVDTCLSCYFQNFGSAMPFVYDLRNVGLMYREYHRVMRHWKEVLQIPILDIVYEELVDDQLGGTRRMLEFLQLPWDDACLKFHESKRIAQTASNDQVRRPIYKTSKQRWRNYERHLGPLIDALGDLAPPGKPL